MDNVEQSIISEQTVLMDKSAENSKLSNNKSKFALNISLSLSLIIYRLLFLLVTSIVASITGYGWMSFVTNFMLVGLTSVLPLSIITLISTFIYIVVFKKSSISLIKVFRIVLICFGVLVIGYEILFIVLVGVSWFSFVLAIAPVLYVLVTLYFILDSTKTIKKLETKKDLERFVHEKN